MKNTPNELLRKALRIKTSKALGSKTSQHLKSQVEAMGIEFVANDDSSQGYYTLRQPKTGRELVISKTRDNVSALFSPYALVTKTANLDKVDLFGFLNTPKKAPVVYFQDERSPKIIAFHKRKDAERSKRIKISYIEKKIEEAKKELADWEAQLAEVKSK